ncbi:2-amino-3,7-dideoxy-D-threo-hept-6-ulosonate synthase [Methanomassiliicoccales archaeon LGM-DZ1]|nr:2-amino-3,7-dideoxy-D-threo-hept-6-ulosonate synthase [Methanomassiliicoccales archaeon LGM-DZ1]
MDGKGIRMERIMDRKTGRAVIIPMDHGISNGPMEGLYDMKATVDAVTNGGATAVIMHKGLIRYSYRGSGKDVGFIIHLSASTDVNPAQANHKVTVTTVEEAIKYGADAVSIQINYGDEYESEMVREAGEISRKCTEWGMPLVIMSYARGHDVNSFDPHQIAHVARASTELGADLVKVNYTGDIDSFHEVVRGALAPVLIAGGPKMSTDMDVLNMVADSIEAGGRGVSMGRNVFQNKNVEGITRAISKIVLENYSAEEAARFLTDDCSEEKRRAGKA